MRIDILTLFPDSLGDVLSESILGRAQERGFIRIEAHQIRDYTASKQCQVDDYPYGGGRGAIMQADPLYRCWEHVCDEAGAQELSLGDFVLTGGEIAAMAVTDAVCRMVPGVLADPECFQDESHFGGLLEYPQYSRPALWHGLQAPEILLSGDHAKVARWRRKQALRRTRARRPDMFERITFETKQEKKLLAEIEEEGWEDGTG